MIKISFLAPRVSLWSFLQRALKMLIKRTISSKNNRKLTVSLPVGLSERVVLSLLWDAEQISQVELASDGPTGVWTGDYIIQQVFEDWPLGQTCEKIAGYFVYFSWKSQRFSWSLNKKKEDKYKQTKPYLLPYNS